MAEVNREELRGVIRLGLDELWPLNGNEDGHIQINGQEEAISAILRGLAEWVVASRFERGDIVAALLEAS